MSNETRDTGDRGRIPAPPWYLRELAERAAELFADVDQSGQTSEWRERAARWREIWEEVKAND